MNDSLALSIEPSELLIDLQSSKPPLLLDVRKAIAFERSTKMLANAKRCAPENIENFTPDKPQQEVVVYCVFGHQVGSDAAQQLRQRGIAARYLAGGIRGGEDGVDAPEDIARWRTTQLPVQAK